MKQTALFLTLIFASTSGYALDPPSWPLGPDAVLPRGEYILSEDTKLAYDALTISDGTTITTSGHDLDLHIREKLTINGDAVIRSFSPSQIPLTPIQASKGDDGRSYDRGPNTEGADVATIGHKGEPGDRGKPGTTGETGYRAGIITLALEPGVKVSGRLVIHNVGGTGGTGGEGGRGGTGGDGQQGGRGLSGLGCDKGPGYGGRAGDGGPGGLGGRGGDGGPGGIIVLQAGSNEAWEWFDTADLKVDGGQSGQPGKGGPGGEAGNPGFGGRGAGFCQGKEADRMGEPGDPGKDETSAFTGEKKGIDGQIKKL
jgi:hypothetical protein